ncbi:MAG: hypothetical protein GY711_09365 [bacterium]|nr:hypothetical protein [bacterium]
MLSTSRLVLSVCTLSLLASHAGAQKIVHTVFGQQNQLRLGGVIAGAGDVNNDGFDDILCGTPSGNSGDGIVWVYSGFDASVLYTRVGSIGQGLGMAVAGVGDVDMDGFDDFAGSAPMQGSGRVVIWSGVDGSVIYDVLGSGPGNDEFGSSIAGLGDLNGDMRDDYAIGAEVALNSSGVRSGVVTIHSGLDGSIIRTFDGDSNQDSFGSRIAAAGNVDGDGFTDLAIAARRDDDNGSASGSVRVVSPRNGTVFYTVFGDVGGDELGWALDGAGDVNMDGADDVIAGPRNEGYARIYSGTSGNVIRTLTGTVGFGSSVAGVGDIDGDGFDDVVVGEQSLGSAPGKANLISGVDGDILFATDGGGQSGAQSYGSSVADAGDVTGDGIHDWIVGANGVDFGAGNGGMIEIIAGANRVGTNYCGPAAANSSGVPGIARVYGTNLVADDCVTLVAARLPVGQFGYFLAGQTQGMIMPPVSQGTLCLSGNIGRYNQVTNIITGPIASLEVDLTSIPVNPPMPVLPGQTWNFTCWYRDSNPGITNNFTDAVSVLFQ